MATALKTTRLLLREWREQDLPAFAALNADPRVMEHMPKLLDRVESDALAARFIDHFAERGFGLWAVEAPEVAEFIGFVGLNVPAYDAHFTPCVEVGWRLAHEHWGRGYAPEGARAALEFAFRELQLHEVVAITVPTNLRSRRVMEKLGMSYSADEDFDHPKLEPGHSLRRHVLYRIQRPQALERQTA